LFRRYWCCSITWQNDYIKFYLFKWFMDNTISFKCCK
jgi:hypothetical protein